MMKSFQLFFIALLFFSCQIVCAQSSVQMPAFSLTEVFTCKRFTQKDLPKDGVIVFNYYDTGCSHCQKMGAGIAQHIDTFKNVKFYFISMNDREYVEGFINMFAKKLKPNNQVTFIHDPDGQFIELFKPTQTPSIYIYDAKTKKLLKHLDGEDDVKKLQVALP
ncbi:redoxin domain-containing protein [Sphingobacterium sp. SRCM116780]|uniref:peroxiredoxin family protein n=1 Tax=Sphingobacterium sp. SRCM116780 TaxID=2907623 RepID=UPI001F213EEA|nr:redoxin domain-containing protein [Sphingobacterium sp. SRCM116780]UIR54513.1 redoxin domain-containing protein [Sphingobacterium sp. SRCM116780]